MVVVRGPYWRTVPGWPRSRIASRVALEQSTANPGKGFRVVWDEHAIPAAIPSVTPRLRRLAKRMRPIPGVATAIEMASRPVEFVKVPGQEFLREPQYRAGSPWRVRLDPYEISRYEITVGQYLEFCKWTRRKEPQFQAGWRRGNFPVTEVTWQNAVEFCRWLTARMNALGTPGIVRLPWEMEWEFAARGGETGLDGRPVRDTVLGPISPTEVRKFGWYNALMPTAVGRFPPNALGIYDMSGNVREWCGDRVSSLLPPPEGFVVNPKGITNPREWDRILRGDSYRDSQPVTLKRRKAALALPVYGSGAEDRGFRVVRQLPSDNS